MNQELRNCQNCNEQFTIEGQDFAFYEKIEVPPPTFCPLCRAQRRYAFYNIRTLYKRKDSKTGKEIFSSFAPDAPFTVYDHDLWWQDAWDPLEYAREVDFSRPFLTQFFELLKRVPLSSRSIQDMVNSDYCNNAGYLKDCYLVFDATKCENCLYASSMNTSKDSLDITHCAKMELSYECFMSGNSSRMFFSSLCENSFDVYFSKNLTGCSYCFGCVNLRNKSYHIFNKPYSKEEYIKTTEQFNLGSYERLEKMKAQAHSFWLKFPHKFMQGLHNSNVSGEYLYNSRNVFNSYEVIEGENIRYSQNIIPKVADCYDYSVWGLNAQRIYESSDCGRGIFQVQFSYDCWPNCKNLTHCIQCHSSSNLFGCVGLRRKQYCILNKQYSQEDYEALVPQIIEHMNEIPYQDKKGRVYRYGEFFPIEFSPFAYNETIAQEHFPLTKDEVLEKGYSWREPDKKAYTITMPVDKLPDRITDVPNTLVNEVISCVHAIPPLSLSSLWSSSCNEQCTTAFKIIPRELEFYRKMSLPLPRLCPNCRHYQRITKRNPLKLWTRKCQCAGKISDRQPTTNYQYVNTVSHRHGVSLCPQEFETSYGPERQEIVYCEQCYQLEVA